ncbi:MAG: 3-phosphoshikimate 1-carboxyvinyltransferase [Faecousia sp.]
MDKVITPRPLGGQIAAIASKSQAHRLLICAALADTPTDLSCAELSKDIEATAACLTALCADTVYQNGVYQITPRPRAAACRCDCGESGSTLRFLLPVAAALGTKTTFQLHGRLPERPLSPLWEELEAHGCKLSRPTADTVLCEGKLTGGTYRMAGNISSQFISGLLFALPLTGEESEIMLTSSLESADYVRMTLAALRTFGIEIEERETGWHIPAGRRYRSCGGAEVEGDWSNAAFWLTAGAISEAVTVTGLSPHSPQGDRKIAALLGRFGAEVTWETDAVTVRPHKLRGIDIDARNIPDLVPPLALAAACAEGTTKIYGAERLKIKESDRLQSVAGALQNLGAQVEILPDGLLIHGGTLTAGTVDSQNDHRIAMLAAIASSVCAEPVTLLGAEAVQKSYPRFWADFETMQKGENPQ